MSDHRELPARPASVRPVPATTATAPAAVSVADGEEKSLDPAAVTVQRIVGTIAASVVSLLALIAAIVVVGSTARGTIGVVVGLAAWAAITAAAALAALLWPPVRYRHISYRVDAHGMQIRRGVWWKSTVNVPQSRVQHTDVQQGPVERGFGLATLIVHTAGTQHASIPLSGLAHPVAMQIRDYLLEEAEDPAGER